MWFMRNKLRLISKVNYVFSLQMENITDDDEDDDMMAK